MAEKPAQHNHSKMDTEEFNDNILDGFDYPSLMISDDLLLNVSENSIYNDLRTLEDDVLDFGNDHFGNSLSFNGKDTLIDI